MAVKAHYGRFFTEGNVLALEALWSGAWLPTSATAALNNRSLKHVSQQDENSNLQTKERGLNSLDFIILSCPTQRWNRKQTMN